jgi:hypothetical protein
MTNGDITVTHDELLAKLEHDGIEPWDYSIPTSHRAIAALRAVVESHEPWELIRPNGDSIVELHKPWNNGDKDICQECANLIDPWNENCYPCPTIQAIEKELK